MRKNTDKTNGMRIFDQKKITYKSYYYINSGVISGIDVATVLNQDTHQVFKTLAEVEEKNIHEL